MILNIGDKVKFLNDVGGGEVTEVIDKDMVTVLTDDGFDFPYPKKDLVKIEVPTGDAFFRAETKVEQPVVEQPKTIQQNLTSDDELVTKENEEVNIYLSFVPTNTKKPTQSDQTLNLVNDSNWYLMYVYQIRKNNLFESFAGVLQPNYVESVNVFKLSEINEMKEIVVQIIFFRKTPYDVKEPIIKRVAIKPQAFYKQSSFEANDFFDDNAITFAIVEENPLADAMNKLKNSDIANVIKEKEIQNKKINKPKEFAKPATLHLVEVDLHLTSLLDNTKGMSKSEMLDFQVDKFKEELAKAQKIHHIKKIVFIHGKGNGSLKTKIRSYLDSNKIKFQDASFQKYGFGATLVFV